MNKKEKQSLILTLGLTLFYCIITIVLICMVQPYWAKWGLLIVCYFLYSISKEMIQERCKKR